MAVHRDKLLWGFIILSRNICDTITWSIVIWTEDVLNFMECFCPPVDILYAVWTVKPSLCFFSFFFICTFLWQPFELFKALFYLTDFWKESQSPAPLPGRPLFHYTESDKRTDFGMFLKQFTIHIPSQMGSRNVLAVTFSLSSLYLMSKEKAFYGKMNSLTGSSGAHCELYLLLNDFSKLMVFRDCFC